MSIRYKNLTSGEKNGHEKIQQMENLHAQLKSDLAVAADHMKRAYNCKVKEACGQGLAH
jgi:hypothetical protein